MQAVTDGAPSAAVAYEGRARPLFWLAIRTLVLTVLTLGIYRFWMKTRLRRFYWSAIRLDGEPLEYTGRPVELLLGFLLAVVVLAVYLAIFNLGLTYVGISYFEGNPAALNLSVLALVPMIFYARFRARRYILSRTRWRGIRFATEKGAVSYAWRACFYALAVVATAGLLVPLMHFNLARFAVNRTWFGDRQFLQLGSWLGLLRYWLWVWLPLVVGLALIGVETWRQTHGFQQPLPREQGVAVAGMAMLLWLWLFVGVIWYGARAFRYLNSNRTLGRSVSLESDLRARRVIGVYITAFIGFVVASLGISMVVGIGGFLVSVGAAVAGFKFAGLEHALAAGEAPGLAIFAVMGLGYLLVFAVFSALNHVFLLQPMLRVQAQSLTVSGLPALAKVRQREGVDLAEAEGFADALDVGAAF